MPDKSAHILYAQIVASTRRFCTYRQPLLGQRRRWLRIEVDLACCRAGYQFVAIRGCASSFDLIVSSYVTVGSLLAEVL